MCQFQGSVNYCFSAINNRHYAFEYFFNYNHGLNPKIFNYFKIKCLNHIKVYIFVMCKWNRTIWHVIYANRKLLKMWPTWPFCQYCLNHKSYIANYIFFCDSYHVTSNLLYMKGYFKHFENLTPIWPTHDPYREAVNSTKNLFKYFLTRSDFKITKTSVSPKWHSSTFSTTVFYCNQFESNNLFFNERKTFILLLSLLISCRVLETSSHTKMNLQTLFRSN